LTIFIRKSVGKMGWRSKLIRYYCYIWCGVENEFHLMGKIDRVREKLPPVEMQDPCAEKPAIDRISSLYDGYAGIALFSTTTDRWHPDDPD